jgi:hypothetical protein
MNTGALVKQLSMKMFAIPDSDSEDDSSTSSGADTPPPPVQKKYVRRLSTIDANGLPALMSAGASIKRQSSRDKALLPPLGDRRNGSNGKPALGAPGAPGSPGLKRLHSAELRSLVSSSASKESSVDEESSSSGSQQRGSGALPPGLMKPTG